MFVVIDTNVLYQALRSNKGASHFILKLIRMRKINMAISVPVFNEFEDVLKRTKSLDDLNLSTENIDKVLRFIAYVGKPFTSHFLFRPNLKDENDNMFVELSVASNSQYLVTNNVRDFIKQAELKFDTFEVVTPSEFVKIWRRKNENQSQCIDIENSSRTETQT